MKKLSLKNLKFETNEVLQRNQLKTVLGGYSGYGLCDNGCGKVGETCTINGKTGTCGIIHCDNVMTRQCFA